MLEMQGVTAGYDGVPVLRDVSINVGRGELVGLLGANNAGKSTLMNAITQADVYVKDQLFATLDATTRRVDVDERRRFLLTDTVGFIRKLPHHLVDSFKATLEEVGQSDLLLHVVDAANPAFPEQMAEVQRVLQEIGADHVPQCVVFNKLDALPAGQRPGALQDAMEVGGQPLARFFVSARTGEGLGPLRDELARSVLAAAQARKTAPEGAAGAIGHNGWMNSREIDE